MPNLGGWELVILIGILVLLFGAKRLPDMARSIGQSARVFKGEMKGMKNDEGAKADGATDQPAAQPAAQPSAQPSAQPAAPQEPKQLPEASAPAAGSTKATEPTRASQQGSGSSSAQ